jgi:putative tricarboxylic transport membrane protein
MEVVSNLALGFGVALTPANLAYCFVGALLGTLIGVLPGLGPVATIAMLLPFTFALDPASSLIMLAGIYYGAQYGGSTTAILVNIPGESSSVVTTIDGYQMARRGRAGTALGIAALASLFAGCFATLVIALAAPRLAEVALSFGPADYFSLMVLGLIGAVILAQGSVLKAIAMVVLGLALGLVGTDVNSGTARFTFGIPELVDGLGFVALTMGVFGIAEVVRNLERPSEEGAQAAVPLRGLLPSAQDLRRSAASILRGTGLGSVLGVLPGGGALLASFAAYTVEKRVATPPRTFGQGDIRGVAAPEAANNAGAQTSFIPMLTLGVPANPTMALMLGALMIQGIAPGPEVVTGRPELFWGLIASMLIGNLILVTLNLPLIGLWVRLLRVRYQYLFPAILIFCGIGVFSVSNSTFDIFLMAAFSIVGYIFYKLDCEPAPLILGFILGPLMEENLRRALLIARGEPQVFLSQPISLTFLIMAGLLLAVICLPRIRKTRDAAMQE